MSVYQDNAKAIDAFRKELREMLDDVSDIDRRILNQALNEGVAYAKYHTPVGKHPNPVEFTVKRGPDAGKVVRFKLNHPIVGGFLQKSWHKLRTQKSAKGVQAEIVNTAEYASFWNDGHNIKNTKDGPSKGWQKGTYVLEKTGDYIEKRLAELFEKEIKAVQKRHDK